MTAFEKLEKEHPEEIDYDFPGNVDACPDDFGYLPQPDYCVYSSPMCRQGEHERCTKCWNREIPEKESEENDEDMSMTKNVELNAFDYKAEYERLTKMLAEQKSNTEELRCMTEQIDSKERLIEEQRIMVDKCMAVIRCVEALVGKKFFY